MAFLLQKLSNLVSRASSRNAFPFTLSDSATATSQLPPFTLHTASPKPAFVKQYPSTTTYSGLKYDSSKRGGRSGSRGSAAVSVRPAGVLKSVKHLRTLKHPNVVTYVTHEGGTPETPPLTLVTEYIEPLLGGRSPPTAPATSADTIRTRAFECLMGLRCLLESVSFLHSNGLYHHGISPHTVVRVISGEWKLFRFDMLWEKGEDDGEELARRQRDRDRNVFVPTEVAAAKWHIVRQFAGAGDVYGCGVLYMMCMCDRLDADYAWKRGLKESVSVLLRTYERVVARVREGGGGAVEDEERERLWVPVDIMKRIVHPDPSRRPSVERLLSEDRGGGTDLFRASLFRMCIFADGLEQALAAIASARFADGVKPMQHPHLRSLYLLATAVRKIPREYLLHKILPKVIHGLTNCPPCSSSQRAESVRIRALFEIVFHLGDRILKEAEAEVHANANSTATELHKRVILYPVITLLCDPKRHLGFREVILGRMDQIASVGSQNMFQRKVLPVMTHSLSQQSSASLRESAVKALVHVVGKISSRTITETVIPICWKLLKDPRKQIRTNVVIAVGLFADHLPSATREKFLVSFFAAALKDRFSFAKLYALKALDATLKYYSVQTLARAVLPVVSPWTVCAHEDIRKVAWSVMRKCFAKLREAVEGGDIERMFAKKMDTAESGGSGSEAEGGARTGSAASTGRERALRGAKSVFSWAKGLIGTETAASASTSSTKAPGIGGTASSRTGRSRTRQSSSSSSGSSATSTSAGSATSSSRTSRPKKTKEGNLSFVTPETQPPRSSGLTPGGEEDDYVRSNLDEMFDDPAGVGAEGYDDGWGDFGDDIFPSVEVQEAQEAERVRQKMADTLDDWKVFTEAQSRLPDDDEEEEGEQQQRRRPAPAPAAAPAPAPAPSRDAFFGIDVDGWGDLDTRIADDWDEPTTSTSGGWGDVDVEEDDSSSKSTSMMMPVVPEKDNDDDDESLRPGWDDFLDVDELKRDMPGSEVTSVSASSAAPPPKEEGDDDVGAAADFWGDFDEDDFDDMPTGTGGGSGSSSSSSSRGRPGGSEAATGTQSLSWDEGFSDSAARKKERRRGSSSSSSSSGGRTRTRTRKSASPKSSRASSSSTTTSTMDDFWAGSSEPATATKKKPPPSKDDEDDLFGGSISIEDSWEDF